MIFEIFIVIISAVALFRISIFVIIAIQNFQRAAQGTLIIEQAQKVGYRVWWTSDEITTITPHPIPKEDLLDYLRIEKPTRFAKWCHDKYLSPKEGIAYLTELPFETPNGFLTTEFLKKKIPQVTIIATVKID